MLVSGPYRAPCIGPFYLAANDRKDMLLLGQARGVFTALLCKQRHDPATANVDPVDNRGARMQGHKLPLGDGIQLPGSLQ